VTPAIFRSVAADLTAEARRLMLQARLVQPDTLNVADRIVGLSERLAEQASLQSPVPAEMQSIAAEFRKELRPSPFMVTATPGGYDKTLADYASSTHGNLKAVELDFYLAASAV
jgi:hypothetical protein